MNYNTWNSRWVLYVQMGRIYSISSYLKFLISIPAVMPVGSGSKYDSSIPSGKSWSFELLLLSFSVPHQNDFYVKQG